MILKPVILYTFIYEKARYNMANEAYFMILCSILSIIPAGIVAIVFLFKTVAISRDMHKMLDTIETIMQDSSNTKYDYHTLLNQIHTAESEAHKVGMKMISIEESLTALSNKWSSRERTENRDRRKVKEKEVETVEEEAEQEMLPLPPGFKLPIDQAFANSPQSQQTIPVRKFGHMPGR